MAMEAEAEEAARKPVRCLAVLCPTATKKHKQLSAVWTLRVQMAVPKSMASTMSQRLVEERSPMDRTVGHLAAVSGRCLPVRIARSV